MKYKIENSSICEGKLPNNAPVVKLKQEFGSMTRTDIVSWRAYCCVLLFHVQVKISLFLIVNRSVPELNTRSILQTGPFFPLGSDLHFVKWGAGFNHAVVAKWREHKHQQPGLWTTERGAAHAYKCRRPDNAHCRGDRKRQVLKSFLTSYHSEEATHRRII